ncbi:MAG: MarR family transcriptional regulator [Gammaproteobacteria bacterium]
MAADRSQALELLLFNTGFLYRMLRWEGRRHGIRWTALMVLKDLSLLGPLNQRQLADIEQLRPATLSLLMKELLAEGLVSRTADANDRRALRVRITPAGQARLERDGARLAQSLEPLLAALDDDALSELVRGETHLAAALRRNVEN